MTNFSHHSHKFPPGISAFFNLSWVKQEIWNLDLEVKVGSVELFDWLLDLPFWSSAPPEPLFDIVPREVLYSNTVHKVHWNRIQNADTSFPIDVIKLGGELVVMDGLHRLANTILNNRNSVSYRVIPKKNVIFTGGEKPGMEFNSP